MTSSYATTAHLPGAPGKPGTIIRPAAIADLPKLVTIHERAFRNFFLTRMGGNFLLRYYELVLMYRRGICLVADTSGLLSGFACGFLDPTGFYTLMRRYGHRFALPAARALGRHPSLLPGIARGIQRMRDAVHASAQSCDLSSIAVAPEAGRSGLGVTLARAFLAQAWSLNASLVRLHTDADENEAANAFYRKLGFREHRHFLQHQGRWMNEYIMNRPNSDEECGSSV
jgi:ribosomal protein S18 acetylase RimI-like enzyme